MTPEEIRAHAAEVQAKYYTPASAPPEQLMSPVAPVAPPVVQSDVPPPAPVQDGSQEPLHVTTVDPGRRVQTVDAFNVGRPEITAGDLAAEGDTTADTLLQHSDAATKAQKEANQKTAGVEQQIADAQAPIQDDRADMDGYLAQQAQGDMAQADVDAKKHFDVLMGYNKEIQDHVANQPTDLWGRAGVNKVAGIIGLVLGGLGGGATGGKNLVVDTLNGLVDQNLKQNEYKYEMLKGKVTTENQAYAQVRATSHDKAEAADRFRLLSIEQTKQQLAQAAGAFAGPQAKARAQAADAQLDAQKVDLEHKIYSDRLANHRAAAEVGVQERAQNLQSIQLQAAEKAASQKTQDEQSVPFWDPTDKSHMTSGDATKLREQQGGAAQVQDVLSEMVTDAQLGGIAAVVANTQGLANLQIALIQQKSLSKRVTEAEANAMHAMTGFLATGNTAALLTAMGSNTVPEALFKAKQQFAQQHVTNLAIGYGLKPSADNPFVKAATEKYSYATDGSEGGPAGGASPLSQYKGPQELAKEAAIAAQQRRTQMNPAGYGAM